MKLRLDYARYRTAESRRRRMPMLTLLIIVTLLHTVVNGFHDGCNVIASIVSSRSMSPRQALLIACLAELVGVLCLGVAVSRTIGTGIYSANVLLMPAATVQTILLSAVIGCIAWNITTYIFRLPSSSSHALIGGLIGAGIVVAGFRAILWKSFFCYVVIPLFVAPIIGFLLAYVLMKILLALFRNFPPKIAVFFKKIQIGSLIFLAMSHGSNDAQKAIGIIGIALTAGSMPVLFQAPYWVVLACALAITVGLSFGGWQIIKTINQQVPQMTSLHSCASQSVSGIVIYLASIIGFPVSTTQTVGSTIMGAGAGYRISNVRWGITQNIVLAWLITIPAAAVLAAITCIIIIKRKSLWAF